MKRNIVIKSEVPSPPYGCELACIPIEAVPFTLGALVLKSQRYWFVSQDDWHRGRKLLAELGASILMDCTKPIVDAIDRVSARLDYGLFGIERSVEGSGTDIEPFIYTPPIAQVPTSDVFSLPGLVAQSDVLRALLANLVTGALSSAAPGEAIPNEKLEAIYQAVLAMGSEDGPTFAQVAQLIAILGA